MLERNLGSVDFLTYHQVMSNEESFIYRYCIATLLNRATLDSILDQSNLAKIKDSHPWVVAKRVTESAHLSNQACPLLIGSLDENSEQKLSHVAIIQSIELQKRSTSALFTEVEIRDIREINPIWEDLDSIALKPSFEQIERENEEGLRTFRYHLDSRTIVPYAICETPAFLMNR